MRITLVNIRSSYFLIICLLMLQQTGFSQLPACSVCSNTNVFHGEFAGSKTINGGGINNSFFGRSTGENNFSGSDNSYFGKDAGMMNNNGDKNSFFGNDAGKENLTGFSNSYVGFGAGKISYSGKENSFFGAYTGYNNLEQTTEIAISGVYNSFFGAYAGYDNQSGQYNSYFGYKAGRYIPKGSNNICIGANSGPPDQNEGIIDNRLYIDNQTTNRPLIYGEFDNDLVRIHGAFEVEVGADIGSSVHVKEKFSQVNEDDILLKISELPLTEWSYKKRPNLRHIGPMAQDFYAAFGLGKGETTISSIDADGVSLVAIKALVKRDIDNKNQILELEKKNQELEKVVLGLVERLEKLEKR